MTTMRFLAALVALPWLGAACEPAAGPGGAAGAETAAAPTEPFERLEAPFIIGRADWRDTTRLGTNNPARQASRAVGLLQLPAAGARCTAFLVAPDVLMTNHHCVASDEEARDAVAVFNYEAGTPLDELDVIVCDTFLGADDALDFALLRCASSDGTRPGDRYGVVPLAADVPAEDAQVYMIHQNCDYVRNPSCEYTKKYSPGAVLAVSRQQVLHTADGMGGSSGAPLFDRETHRVIALHHAGYGDPETGRGEWNEALLMRDVLAVLREDFPDVLGAALPSPEDPPDDPPDRPPDAVQLLPVTWESAHPYGREAGFERTFAVPGAARLRVHFARVDTEEEYDVVLVSGGGARERYSGALGEVTTGWFYGDRVTVRFESDESVEEWGFLVDGIDWVP